MTYDEMEDCGDFLLVSRSEKATCYGFVCLACDRLHFYTFSVSTGWTFNGSEEKPTFKPSFRVFPVPNYQKMCHLYVTDGKIRYCNDSDHDLAGKTVDMVPVRAWLGDQHE